QELTVKRWATFDGDEAKNLLGFASPEIGTTFVENIEDSKLKKSRSPEIGTTFVENIEDSKKQSERSLNHDLPVPKSGLNSPDLGTKQSLNRDSHIRNNQQRNQQRNQGEGEETQNLQIQPTPSQVSNLENLVKAVQTVTGVKASSWRLEGEIRTAAI